MALRQTLGYLPQEFGAYPRTSAVTMLKHLAALKGIHGSQQRKAVENLLVKRGEVAEIRARRTVLSTRLRAGAMEIRVLSDSQPESMQPAAPGLEDVYFSTLIDHNLKDNLE